MKAVIQRVRQASVSVEGGVVGKCGGGFLILLGVNTSDTTSEADRLASKIVNLRIFEDSEGKLNLSALDISAELLVVSQFTLYADTRKGRRPSFGQAAPSAQAEPLVNYFVEVLRKTNLKVETGSFGANMLVNLENDGPVTIIMDTAEMN